MRRCLGLLCALTAAAAPPSLGAQALVGVYPAGVGLDSGGRASVPLFVDLTGAGGGGGRCWGRISCGSRGTRR